MESDQCELGVGPLRSWLLCLMLGTQLERVGWMLCVNCMAGFGMVGTDRDV